MSQSLEPAKRYSDKELSEFDTLLTSKLEVAQEQLEYYLNQLKELGSGADAKLKGLEDGNASQESEKIHNLAARQKKLIVHLRNAKLRIKNKVYGVCRDTGELISKNRLLAVPHATLSIKAKEARSK